MQSTRVFLILMVAFVGACGSCAETTPPDQDAGVELDAGGDVGTDGGGGAIEQQAILDVEESQEIQIPALDAPVHVVRTAADVPHIYAESEHDMYVAAGYVLARDRYFEYDVASRLALGELSELLGSFAVEADIDARGRGMKLVAEGILGHMDDDTGASFDAFAEGINAYVDLAKEGEAPPPSEYVLAAPIVGAPSAADIMRRANRRTVAGFAAFVVFESSYVDHDLQRQMVADSMADKFESDALRRAGVDELFDDTTPRHEISVAPGWGLNGGLTTTQTARFRRPSGTSPRPLPRLPASMWERIRAKSQRHALWFGTREASDKGSNAWAVSSTETPDDSVLLAGDGHLALGVPTLFFQMGLDLQTFGDEEFRVMGLFLPGFPFLAVGTNGDIAWSQTYPRADVIDWYREEIRLDGDGLPQDSYFDGEWRALQKVDEEYHVKGVLGADDEDVIHPRWTTFDGRVITEIEGRTVENPNDEMLAAGEALVNVTGIWVVPSDVDGDGVISAVSMDFTAFDIGNLADSIEGLQRAEDVESFQEQMKNFVGYAQNLVVADRGGTVGFATFTAMPCRDYLPRDGDGGWVEGANPQLLLDGTQYGGFEVPVDDEGQFDPELADGDPQKCMLDFDVYPRVVKDEGFVANANNDPHGGTFDGSLENDPFYIGGPWVPGYRANAIVSGLEEVSGEADVEAMAEIQGDHRSHVGADFVPELVRAVQAASEASGKTDGELTESEIRLRDLYDADSGRIDEAITRLRAWIDRGANAASGVKTFYNDPTETDRDDAVATMIFNAWFRQWILAIFEDEDIRPLLQQPGRSRGAMIRALRRLTEGRGAGNPMGLGSWNPSTEESIFFDDMTTEAVTERSEEIAVSALVAALDGLAAEPASGANGGFGTSDMDQWLWGLRHRVVLDSILASFAEGNAAISAVASDFSIDTDVLPLDEDIGSDDPRRKLDWFPRPGDYFGVDAANPSFYGEDFDYSAGPVMRMVIKIAPDGTVTGQNIIPGGQSGLTDSEHFADQAALWLGNETLPIQYDPIQVSEAATARELLTP